MKIGIFDPYLDTMSGGEKYMLSIASCLSSQHEVSIFWDKEKKTEIKNQAIKKLGIDLSSVKFYKNIFSLHVSSISRFFESRKFDAIIYLSDGSIPFVASNLILHFQFPVEWVSNSIKTKLKLLRVKKIICNSEFTKIFIDKKLNVNSKVLYPPTNIKKFSVEKENIILHVGRLDVDREESNYKKQDVMIKVFKKIADQGLKDWKFILIIGVKNKEKDKLNKLRKISEGYPIEIMENPSNKILWRNYSKAKIYWHATGFGEDLQRYPEKAEHFGISIVEAMGAGCVPVVINAGGQKEIVQDSRNGYLWDSLEDFITKTSSLIKNEDLWQKMSKDAVKRSKIFSVDKFCNNLKDIIK